MAFRKQLREELAESRRLAIEVLGGEATINALPKPLRQLVSFDGYAQLVGALCCNSISVVYVSPLVQHLLQVDAMPAKSKERMEAINILEPWLRELIAVRGSDCSDDSESDGSAEEQTSAPSGDVHRFCWEVPGGGRLDFTSELLPSFKGYAIFPRLALANHACDPSCAVEFTFQGSLFLLAQKKADAACTLRVGDELTISYLDASLGVNAAPTGAEKRRRQLEAYGFRCQCSLCSAEDAAAGHANIASRKRRRT